MPMDAVSLEALQNLNQPVIEQRVAAGAGTGDGSLGNFRLDALREAATGVGARGGLLAETKLINGELKKNARQYDTIYNFAPLMIEGRVVPPVLTQTKDLYAQRGVDTIRLAKQDWTILAQAHFASRPPTWREYILAEPGTLAMPSNILLPKNDAEREIWRVAVAAGWEMGIKQADDAFKINRNRLVRDYRGMVNYHLLAARKMVTLPIVAQLNMPLNSTGQTMTMDETVLRLTAVPQFDTNMNNWQSLGEEVDRLQQPAPASAASPASDGGE